MALWKSVGFKTFELLIDPFCKFFRVSLYGTRIPFNLRDLRRAIAVAEHRSLRQAALVLEVDQGTLTRSIQALEYALRIPLFERMRTGVQLTAAGVAFTKIAASVLDGNHTHSGRRIWTPRIESCVANLVLAV